MVETVAGNGGKGVTYGSGDQASFSFPVCVEVINSSQLLVCDGERWVIVTLPQQSNSTPSLTKSIDTPPSTSVISNNSTQLEQILKLQQDLSVEQQEKAILQESKKALEHDMQAQLKQHQSNETKLQSYINQLEQ